MPRGLKEEENRGQIRREKERDESMELSQIEQSRDRGEKLEFTGWSESLGSLVNLDLNKYLGLHRCHRLIQIYAVHCSFIKGIV